MSLASTPVAPAFDLTPEQLEAAQTLASLLGPHLDKVPSSSDLLPTTTSPQARFSPEDLFDFAATRFYVPDGGKDRATPAPITLEPIQLCILRLMFSPTFAQRYGLDCFQRYIYSTVKKSGKTSIAALIARWITERWGGMNEVYTVANDLDQSRGLVYDKILKSIQLDPRYDRSRDEIPGEWDIIRRDATHLPSRSTIKPLSGDYKGQAGMNPTATFWSELWGYTLEGSQRLWDELTPVPTRPRSIRYVETYAGFLGESQLLIEQYEIGTDPARGAIRLTREDVPDWPGSETGALPLYVNPSARQFTYWDDGEVARRMPWQTEGYYQSEAIALRPEAFDRLHLNLWVSPVNTMMPIEWWDSCLARADEPVPTQIDPDEPLICSADASVSGDCTGATLVSRFRGDTEKVVLRRSALWTPRAGSTINYSLTLEPTLRQWITGHIHPLNQSCSGHDYVDQLGVCVPTRPLNILQLAYDMYQLHDMMTRFQNEGLVWVYPFSQGGDRMVADHMLYTYIRDRKILHTGDPDVREHIGNSAAKVAKDSNTKMRIVKKTAKSKIDLAVCLSMGVHECKRLNLS